MASYRFRAIAYRQSIITAFFGAGKETRMTDTLAARPAGRRTFPDAALNAAATLWFWVTLAGQWTFLYFIAAFYGLSTVSGNFADWNRNPFLSHGYIAGDTMGNFAFAGHVLMAMVVVLGGTLQLVAQVRRRAAWLHRWNGRIFLTMAMLVAATGLVMDVTREIALEVLASNFAISFNGVLVLVLGTLTWRMAAARNYASHRRWALRTFLLANGVLFLRLGYMAWIIINQGPVGIAKGGGGWFDISWKLGSFLLPLLILEIYLRVKQSGGTSAKFATSVLLVASSVVTAIGAFGAFNVFWRPLL